MSARQSITPPAPVTVIGLGNMGIPMALRLAKAGFQVTGFDISEASRQKFSAAGGRAVANGIEAVKSADVVITLLPDGKAVRAALEPLRKGFKPGCILIDMSSSEPLGTRALGGSFIAAGFAFIDAPVSGGVRRAADGTLAIMAGGDAATIDRVEPVLAAMGRAIFRTGGLGSGHTMKALNNYVSAAGLIAAVEAIEIGRKFGLDPNLMADIFNASTGRNNTTEVKLKQFIISGSFNAGFPLRLMAKDVRTADRLGHEIGVPVPFADACAELWDGAAEALDAAADHTEIGRYIETLKA
ncbi:MAG TPA: NAD(P)-dependent oxidoreductase [Xanthobacteraceae bacterium]|nr:NAD(P)-dependent oxidoreductase [Xanthobacteraceae bacterium]